MLRLRPLTVAMLIIACGHADLDTNEDITLSAGDTLNEKDAALVFSFESGGLSAFEVFNATGEIYAPSNPCPNGKNIAKVTSNTGTYFSIGTASGAFATPPTGATVSAAASAVAWASSTVGDSAQVIIRERDASGSTVAQSAAPAIALSANWSVLPTVAHVVRSGSNKLDVRVRVGGTAGDAVGVDLMLIGSSSAGPIVPPPTAPTPTPSPQQPQPTPTPEPDPDPTPNPTPGNVSLFDRPFPQSAVYQPIPSSEPNHPNSAAMVAAFVATGKNFDRSNGPRRWQGKPTDPVWSCGSNGFKMYAPANIYGSGGADDTIEIYNDVTPGNGPPRVVRMWGGDSVPLSINRSNYTIRGSTFGVADASGNGVPISGAGTAWGLFSALGVMLYRGDYVQGEIDHAIGAALGTNLLARGQFMAPARAQETKATGSLVPMGARFQFVGPQSAIDDVIANSGLAGNGLDKVAKMYFRAASRYGIIIRDGTGTNGLNNYGDVTNEWSNVTTYQYWGDIFRKTGGLWKTNYWRVPARSAY